MQSFQEILFKLKRYWAERGCIIQEPYDVEVGAGTMCPETFLRVLGPKPYRVAYVQPSRRPADGRYGDNPNRLYKHMQLQVVLKPTPADVIEQYMGSLEAIGIDLRKHDLKLEEDNWENPSLGAWGVGWQVMLDGLEISQFTYFQQCGGIDLSPVPVEITYGLERLEMFLEQKENIYDLDWSADVTYRDLRLREEKEFSEYNFGAADVASLRHAFQASTREAGRLIEKNLLLPAYDMCLKCSHTFNLLDARGAISVTERVKLIGEIRVLVNEIARRYTAGKEGA